jgi:hypothetical protein
MLPYRKESNYEATAYPVAVHRDVTIGRRMYSLLPGQTGVLCEIWGLHRCGCGLTPCSLMQRYWSFRGTCYLRLQGRIWCRTAINTILEPCSDYFGSLKLRSLNSVKRIYVYIYKISFLNNVKPKYNLRNNGAININSLCGLVVRVPGYRSWSPGFDSRRYQIFWEVVGLERGPLSLVRITEELLEWKSSGSGLRNRGDPLRWPRDTPLSAKVGTNLADMWRSLGRYSLLAD